MNFIIKKHMKYMAFIFAKGKSWTAQKASLF